MLKTNVAVSIGLLRNVAYWPAVEMPEWANTAARRMWDMGVNNARIKEVIEQMEIERRKKFRETLANRTPVTEFDEHLADLFNRFGVIEK